ncbi:hypothetical protein [Marinovum sp.]|uniref:hypothetical protein n=1 Tax=Marinovum sp. TaxID=2024839 RepID=UPI002B2666DD|nr:hypothetical protein [Marinovum sp.]
MANAYEILGEDPQRALDEELNPARAVFSLGENVSAQNKLRLEDVEFEIKLIAFWIMNRLDEDYGAAICSPAGNLLRASHPIFFHPDQFFYFYLSFPLRQMPELSTIFEEYDAKRMRADDLWNRYSCLDGDTGLIKQKNQTERNFENYFCGTMDGNPDGGVFERYVKPFLGWYVVWGEDLFPEDLFGLFESIQLVNRHWKNTGERSQVSKGSKKRGAKPSPAKREFERRYPGGIPSELSAEAIAAELTEAGFPITGRSILSYEKNGRVSK